MMQQSRTLPEKPFAGQHHDLGLCSLHPLDGNRADLLSRGIAELDPWKKLGYSSEALARYLSRSDPALGRFEVSAAHGKEAAGVLCVRYPWLCGPYIELFAVFPAHQAKGLGSALVEWTAAQTSSKNLWAAVSSFNDAGRRFYQKAGFEEIAHLPGLVREDFDEILLRKVLCSTAVTHRKADLGKSYQQ